MSRNLRKGVLEYRVHWKGYPDYENPWEPVSRFSKEVPELIKEFERVQALKPKSKRKKH